MILKTVRTYLVLLPCLYLLIASSMVIYK